MATEIGLWSVYQTVLLPGDKRPTVFRFVAAARDATEALSLVQANQGAPGSTWDVDPEPDHFGFMCMGPLSASEMRTRRRLP